MAAARDRNERTVGDSRKDRSPRRQLVGVVGDDKCPFWKDAIMGLLFVKAITGPASADICWQQNQLTK